MHLRMRCPALGVAACLVAVLLGGCAARYISQYDEQTDRSVTALQRSVEGFLVKLEGLGKPPACSYENHQGFYQDSRVELSAVEVRAAAMPRNAITLEQLELLAGSLRNLEALHRLKGRQQACLGADEIAPLRVAFNTSFTAILKLELAKKRGEAP